MTMQTEHGAVTVFQTPEEWQESKAFRILLLLTKDEVGTISAVALNLPGAGSCGDSEEEAIENTKEAVRGVIQSYLDSAAEIPWQEPPSDHIPFEAKRKWIIVDV